MRCFTTGGVRRALSFAASCSCCACFSCWLILSSIACWFITGCAGVVVSAAIAGSLNCALHCGHTHISCLFPWKPARPPTSPNVITPSSPFLALYPRSVQTMSRHPHLGQQYAIIQALHFQKFAVHCKVGLMPCYYLCTSKTPHQHSKRRGAMPCSRGSPQTSKQTAKAPRYFAECHCMLIASLLARW